jgi:dihydrofolate reductase
MKAGSLFFFVKVSICTRVVRLKGEQTVRDEKTSAPCSVSADSRNKSVNSGKSMRKLIAGMKMSVDEKIEGPDGYADWVETWSDSYGLIPQIDACLLGGTMFGGYEQYWSAVRNEPNKPLPMTDRLPTAAELEYARFAGQTPHYVWSRTLTSSLWPGTKFIRKIEDIAALKKQSGKDIYLVGGARTVSTLIDAGLVDELRLIVYPLIAGSGKPLFPAVEHRRALDLQKVEQLQNGRLSLVYGVGDVIRQNLDLGGSSDE